MATQLTQEQYVDNSWAQFEKNYNFKMKFGADALKQKLDAERQGKGLDKVDQQFVLDVLGSMTQDAEKHLTLHLEKANELRQSTLTPRAKTPKQINENIVDRDLSNTNRATPPWPGAEKLDIAIRKAAENVANAMNSNEPASFTTAFDNMRDAAEAKLRNQHKHKLAMQMRPSRKIETPRAGG